MEEIEELRAKAIASMRSSAKGNTSSTDTVVAGGGRCGSGKFKHPKSREEGELLSSEEEELATCSNTRTNIANLGDYMPYTLRNNPINEVKRAPAAHLSSAGMKFRPSVSQNHQKRYHKHFKRKHLPFRSLSNQALQWHAKESKNNLIISFSDDSGSESEECSPEKDVKRMDSTAIACNSRAPDRINLSSKKEYTNHATISSVYSAYETNSRPQGTSKENDSFLYKKSPTINASSSQAPVHVQDSAKPDQRLELLRNLIAARENKLKGQNESVLKKGAIVGSNSNQSGLNAMKAEGRATGIWSPTTTTLEFEANEPSKKRSKHDKSSAVLDIDVHRNHENARTFPADSCTYSRHEDNTVKSHVLRSKDSFPALSTANLYDGALSLNDNTERCVRSGNISKRVEASNLPSIHASSGHVINGKQQLIPKTNGLIPLERFSIDERSSDLELGNKEIYPNQENVKEEGNIPLDYLVNLEELHDKELEEAQEHRYKCELEERHALIAYRKAQRALVEANERCSFLYGKREIFSAKFRAFVMEASNSIRPSNWLCRQNPHEDRFYEPDASTSVHRDSGALDGAVPPAYNTNMLTDDDGGDFNRAVESGSTHFDTQIEKELPLDNSQDYELLEASLRSKLVARLGLRASSKVNGTGKTKLDVENIAGGVADNMEPSPLSSEKVMPSSERKHTSKLEDLDINNSFHEDSGNSSYTATFFLPSSELHTICRHTYMIFPECHPEPLNIKENGYSVRVEDIGAVPHAYKSSVEIDPFWPLCMFEFRGKCNDGECPWQHTKAGKDHPDVPDSVLHALPIPTYQIGQYHIKADSGHSQFVLARSNWPYQQRGFCASFSIPFSIQRILPLDAPFLQSGDDTVADYYSRNRLSLHHQSRDGTSLFKEQIKYGSFDIEQVLEMTLDHFDKEFYESDKKALSLLAHAIESYPSSTLLWVIYLYIYYRKETLIGKDDMFLHAVQHNKGSYELWLLYINSRMHYKDRLNAYDRALDVLCHDEGIDGCKYFSSYILDIFLQMVDFLCMCEHVDKAISRICKLLPCNEFGKSTPIPDIFTCLTVSDGCLFWTSCIYFLVYEKLPEAIVQQFEFVKNLSFRLDWPSAEVTSDRKELALKCMELAMSEMASHLDKNPQEIDQASIQSLHFLATSHVKCTAALQGSPAYTELLDKYLKLYPSCMELVLMAIRSQENFVSDSDFLVFEEALYHWPKESPGIQCLWNQYAEYALANGRIDLTEKLMARWHQDFQESMVLCDSCSPVNENSTDEVQLKINDSAFGFLNLCLYWMLQKNVVDARSAIDKSLELAAPEHYIHFVREHALFMTSIDTKSQEYFPLGSLSTLLNHYLADPRSSFQLEPLSKKFVQSIKKPRIQQMVNSILGPVSMGSSLVNSVMQVCYGPSFLPDKFNAIKTAVSFLESLLERMPANYELALSIYKSLSRNSILNPDCKSLKFWACCHLINSIFMATPVAPEHTWLEATRVVSKSESVEVSLRFHKQAISVYPFSFKLWQSYANLYTIIGDPNEIIEAAHERGIELNSVLN